MQRDISDMKSLMSRMVEALGKITVIEERQHAMAQATNKVLERMEAITGRQHEQDLLAAANGTISARVKDLELSVRESHLEAERVKARFQTIVWTLRGLWLVAGSSAGVWLLQALLTIAR